MDPSALHISLWFFLALDIGLAFAIRLHYVFLRIISTPFPGGTMGNLYEMENKYIDGSRIYQASTFIRLTVSQSAQLLIHLRVALIIPNDSAALDLQFPRRVASNEVPNP